MRRFFKKLFSRMGETYTELLISVLIIAISAFVIALLYRSAASMNFSARDDGKEFYQAVSEAESESAPDPSQWEIEYLPA